MPRIAVQVPNTCARCLRALRPQDASSTALTRGRRSISRLSPLQTPQATAAKIEDDENTSAKNGSADSDTRAVSPPEPEREQGAMSRRLAQATEDALLEGGRAGQRAIEEAGFSEELKARLLDRIEGHQFKAENAAAFAEVELPSVAGRGTRDIAMAQPWLGTESTGDAVLRMLSDAHKPLKPGLRGDANAPAAVDMRLQGRSRQTPGHRLSKAKERTSIYSMSQDSQMSDKEREEMRATLKERFGSAVQTGSMPTSFRGLEGLANQRIEDAIARGQFKNIPRGKGVVRDARADNPFIDTTEYIMNKMIQNQDCVPPWIEKQQELRRAMETFRAGLRNDWKRHAARTISSRGGSLQEQVARADLYAQSERAHNPKSTGIGQVSIPGDMTEHSVTVESTQVNGADAPADPTPTTVQASVETEPGATPITDPTPVPQPQPATPLPPPFRDPTWEAAELSYRTLALANLNALTRSYNLQAPELAKKPYLSLERELRSCYADVAPLLGRDIIERARVSEGGGGGPRVAAGGEGVVEGFAGAEGKVYDETKPQYGFKQLWGDLFGKRG